LELTLKRPDTQQQQQEQNNYYNNNYSNNRPIIFTWKRNRLYDQLFTLDFYESCLDDPTCVVTDLSGRPKNKWRPVPLATVELQKRASRYLRIGSQALMTAAEGLYNEGYISYPRTETERFRPEFQHRPLIQDFASRGGEFGEYVI
jgi:DNA topoisomerase-3